MSASKSVFTEIAQKQAWGGGDETISGPGSTLRETVMLRAALPGVLAELGIRKLVDAPCGDRNWMRRLEYKFDLYVGVDIVESVVDMLRVEQSSEFANFQCGNIVTDILPTADAVLCRDCLVHWPYEMVWEALRRFKLAGFRFLLTTTFPLHDTNHDVATGGWRPLNLRAGPFSFPDPVRLIAERVPNEDDPFRDKSLGVWDLSQIPDKPAATKIQIATNPPSGLNIHELASCIDLVSSKPHFACATIVRRRMLDFDVEKQYTLPHWDQNYRVIQFWDTEEVPDDVRPLVASWKEALPDGCHVLFDQSAARDFIAEHYETEVVEAFDYCHHPAMKSDLFRLAYLFINGGVYIDADERPIRPLPNVNVARDGFLALYPLIRERNQAGQVVLLRPAELKSRPQTANGSECYFANSPIFAAKKNPALAVALMRATRRILEAKKQDATCEIHDVTGPTNLTLCVAAHLVQSAFSGRRPADIRIIDWPRYSAGMSLEYKKDSRNWRTAGAAARQGST